MTETLGFAFAAGLVAAVNPCGFALLPAYLTLVVLGDGNSDGNCDGDDNDGDGPRAGRRVAVARALAATATMTIGFLAVFGAFGLLVAPVAASSQRHLPVVTIVVGGALVAVGCWLLTGRELRVLVPKPVGVAPTRQLRSMLLYGVGYALASLSCTIAPFLVVTATTFGAGDPLTGLAAYGVYALGMGLLVGVLAVAVALARGTVAGRLRRVLPYTGRIGGALVLAVGGYLVYYGVYELRLFNFGADAADPVVDGAGRIQSWLVDTVDAVGWPPLLAALALLVALGFGAGRFTARQLTRR